ncbi:GNAT family N-acetyltransferase [Clostridium sp.]|uniref:GNAT family N-acetyltransferase n=1 Tax=Clostridium sp. TaxID=1506 RepID=UPI00261D7CD2|nr:GNAT family N-acetyltransferase [Clostridium sp.]
MINHIGATEIETNRLMLRRFSTEDAIDMFHNWTHDSEVTKYLTWLNHENIETTYKILKIWKDNYKNIDYYHWAIELKESKQVVGSISLINLDDYNENCEIGYCIGKEFWNKGITTEALSNIINFAFTQIGFKRITGKHHIRNLASGRVMKKCGLKYEGVLRKIIKDGNGVLVDCKCYSILNDEYLN